MVTPSCWATRLGLPLTVRSRIVRPGTRQSGRRRPGRSGQCTEARRSRRPGLDPAGVGTGRDAFDGPRRRDRVPTGTAGRGRGGGPVGGRPVDARTDRRLRRRDDHREPTGRGHRGGVLDTPQACDPAVSGPRVDIALAMPVRVMVVDDHPIWRDALARDLAEAGYQVTAAVGEGAQAVRVA